MKLTETKDKYNLKGWAECESCKGTGLYNGFAEKDGARVICTSCDGKGVVPVDCVWNKFVERKIDKGAKRVYTNGMGYGITDKDVTVDGKFFPFSQYGCSYEEWKSGVQPKPLEFLGCPYQETRQSLQSKDKNGLYKTRCNKGLGCGYISDCKYFHDKATCWKVYRGAK
jgi:hypothetical protein